MKSNIQTSVPCIEFQPSSRSQAQPSLRKDDEEKNQNSTHAIVAKTLPHLGKKQTNKPTGCPAIVLWFRADPPNSLTFLNFFFECC